MHAQQTPERTFPFEPFKSIVDCATIYCDKRGWKLAATCLRTARIRTLSPVERGHSETYDWGSYWDMLLELNHEEFASMAGRAGRLEVEGHVRSALSETVQDRFSPDYLGCVSVAPKLDLVTNKERLRNAINNQGNGHSKHPAAIEYDGLWFRTKEEVFLYRALKAQGALVAPGPVFVKERALRRRVEPDFLVIKDGVVLVVELDGGSHNDETPAEAQERLLALEQAGCRVRRVQATDCGSDAQAAKIAKDILAHISAVKFSSL